MHCPQCGHQQNLDESRFCTKCGLDISDFKSLLTSGLDRTKRKKAQKKATKQGFLMILFGLGLVMILGALRESFPIPKIIIILPLLFFMIGGMIRMILPLLSNDSPNEENFDPFLDDLETRNLPSEENSSKTLPEAQFQPPINFNVSKYDTNELVTPSSVTENTTKKLEKKLNEN